jgi:hypothetical protein
MDSADRGADTRTLLDPVDAAVEIGDSEQEVIDDRYYRLKILSHDDRRTAQQQESAREGRRHGPSIP